MFKRIALMVLCIGALLLTLSAADVQPAQFKSNGDFSGGTARDDVALTSVRFHKHDGFTRMVLDLSHHNDGTITGGAPQHPIYSIEYQQFPYRLVVKLQDVLFDQNAKVTTDPALPFSIVAHENGCIKEMQIFLEEPSEFKVIEIDDPAKLAIDVRPIRVDIPSIYTVQVIDAKTVSEGFALLDQGQFPEGYNPEILILGDLVVIEQVFTDPASAAAMEAKLSEMGYTSVINERRGNELPQV